MVDASYFDGKTSRRHPVVLRADSSGLELAGDGWHKREPKAAIRVSEPIGAAPRTLSFADGAYCEVAQGDALTALLSALGHRDHAVARWQSSWRLAVTGLLFVVVLMGAGYRWGLPWFAEYSAQRLPPALVSGMSEQVMTALDRRLLKESSVAADRQAALEAGFRRIVASDPALKGSQLLFRSAPKIGPNAFALPDGRIVLFDQLVELAEHDDELLGVLAHELGHVKYQHGIRQLIQSSVVAAVAASYFGDLSSLLSGMTALLLESKYSRSFELEADAFAAATMRRQGMSVDGLVQILEKMERFHDKESSPKSSSTDWLSTHPDTAERIARLRGSN